MLGVLPSPPRRAWPRAFGLAVGVWAGLGVGVAAPLDPWGKAAAGLLTASIAGLLSVLRPAEATVAYRAWNKAARMYERAACTAVLALCYGVVAAAGCAGSSLRLQRPAPERSLWYPKATLSLDAYRSQADRPGRPSTGHPWLEVVAWARRSGNTWAVVLVPFLALIGTLDDRDRDDAAPAGIYTLF